MQLKCFRFFKDLERKTYSIYTRYLAGLLAGMNPAHLTSKYQVIRLDIRIPGNDILTKKISVMGIVKQYLFLKLR
jgi:hypothetical protein